MTTDESDKRMGDLEQQVHQLQRWGWGYEGLREPDMPGREKYADQRVRLREQHVALLERYRSQQRRGYWALAGVLVLNTLIILLLNYFHLSPWYVVVATAPEIVLALWAVSLDRPWWANNRYNVNLRRTDPPEEK